MNKTCDRCGKEIPNSEHRIMSDIDTYWCDPCEEAMEGETAEEMMARLDDREALGMEMRPQRAISLDPATGVLEIRDEDGA